MQLKQRYRWQSYRSMTPRNVQHFPSASGRMTPNSVCLWRHREHGDSNKLWRQRWFEQSPRRVHCKMINGNVSSDDLRVCTELQVFPKLFRTSGFRLTKSTRTVTLQVDISPQRQIRSPICHCRSDNFSSAISGKWHRAPDNFWVQCVFTPIFLLNADFQISKSIFTPCNF